MAVDVSHLAEAEEVGHQGGGGEQGDFQGVGCFQGPGRSLHECGKQQPGSPAAVRGCKEPQQGQAGGAPLPHVQGTEPASSPRRGKKPKKNMDITIHNVWSDGSDNLPTKLVPEIFTPAGLPGCSTQVLKSMAGNAW